MDVIETAIEKLKGLQQTDDTEAAHCDADQILCELLQHLGHGNVIVEYHKIKKWYA